MPHWNQLLATCPHTTIDASELRVGLPAGPDGQLRSRPPQHRRGPRRSTRISRASTSRSQRASSPRNPVLTDAVATAARNRSRAARAGARCRPAACTATSARSRRWSRWRPPRGRAAASACTPSSTAATRRREAPPRRSRSWTACARGIAGARIASICGRYYAMDRDQRWERVAPAYELLVDGDGAVRRGVDRRRRSTRPTRAARSTSSSSRRRSWPPRGAPARMDDGDVVVFMNFRADRARADDARADRSRRSTAFRARACRSSAASSA